MPDLLSFSNIQTFAGLPVPLHNGTAGNGLANLSGLPADVPTAAPEILFGEFPGLQRSVMQRPTAHPLRGRITGPVRLIEVVRTAWALSETQLAQLLAYPSVELIGRLLQGGITFRTESDQGDRVRIMYRIHSTLAGLFINPADERRWLRDRTDILDRLSPLDYMLEHRIPGMLRVEELVERRLANR